MINAALRSNWATSRRLWRHAPSCSFHALQPSFQSVQSLQTEDLPLQLTLAIIKPHICKDPHSLQEIRQIILNDGFHYIRTCQKELTTSEAQQFYGEHAGKFFYNRLVTFMTSGEISVHILARVDAIARWRTLMGPTKVYRTRLEHPDTIRGRFGASDTRNATHGSDSVESATREIGFFFPEFSIKKWFDDEEHLYRRSGIDKTKGREVIAFDELTWQHRIVANCAE